MRKTFDEFFLINILFFIFGKFSENFDKLKNFWYNIITEKNFLKIFKIFG